MNSRAKRNFHSYFATGLATHAPHDLSLPHKCMCWVHESPSPVCHVLYPLVKIATVLGTVFHTNLHLPPGSGRGAPAAIFYGL